MRFFVESVTRPLSTGKNRKGAILQKVAKQFEHVIIGDNNALTALKTVFERLVAACNSTYSGKRLKVTWNKYSHQLTVEPEDRSANFSESVVFTMQLAPVGLTFFASNVHQAVNSDLVDNNDPKLLCAYRSKQINDYLEEGGEK